MDWKKVENGDKTLFILENNKLDICIHKQDNTSEWFLTCEKLGIVKRSLDTNDFNIAVKEAQIIVITIADELYNLACNFIKNIYDNNEFC